MGDEEDETRVTNMVDDEQRLFYPRCGRNLTGHPELAIQQIQNHHFHLQDQPKTQD